MIERITSFCVAFGLALTFAPSSGTAQFSSGAVWGDTTVEVVEPGAQQGIEAVEPYSPNDDQTVDPTIDASDLPQAMQYNDVLQLNQQVAAATVTVRAVFRRDPLLSPSLVEVEGAATWVDPGDGSAPVLLTASYLVNGAERVELVTPDGVVTVASSVNARYGLALLTPNGSVTPTSTLSLAPARAETTTEVFGPIPGSIGGTLGAAEGEFGYYQLNNTGVALGHPVIDRNGNLVGIGSHMFPSNPGMSLSISAHSVEEFLNTRQAVEQ